jgi:hypothetical protein
VRAPRRAIPGRQMVTVEWVARMGAVTAEALAVRDGRTTGSARACLLAAARAGLVLRERPLSEEAALFTATRAGLRAVGLDAVDPVRVSPATARHSIVCARVAAALERLYPDHVVIGERELRGCRSSEPVACARLSGAGGGASALHRPDLALCPSGAALPIAVEVELTVKAPQRLRAICRGWARSRSVAGVLYLAAPQVRAPLARAIAAARAEQAIAVVELEAFDSLASAPPPREPSP